MKDNKELNKDINKIAIIDFHNGGGFNLNIDKKYIALDDVVACAVTLKNTGTVKASEVIFKSKFNEYGHIIPGTVFINDIQQGVADPTFSKGIIVGEAYPDEVINIKYKVKVDKIPIDNNVKFMGEVTFKYIDNFQQLNYSYGKSNLELSILNIAQIRKEDVVSTYSAKNKFIEVNEVISYKIKIKNSGNIQGNNILLKGNFSKGISFISDSIYVNCMKSLGIINNEHIEIPVGVLNPNEDSIITFDFIVNEIPTDNILRGNFKVYYSYMENPELEQKSESIICNEMSIPFINANFNRANFKVECNREFADRDDDITYYIYLKNKGSTKALDVLIQDILPKDMEILKDSTYINGVLKTNLYSNGHMYIGDIDVEEEVRISYKARLNKCILVNFIKNECKLNYNYEIEDGKTINKFKKAKTVYTTINSASIGRDPESFTKLVDKAYVRVGEEVKYTLRIRNTGNIEANNLCIRDNVCKGLIFINGSLCINNIPKENKSIISGVYLEKLEPEELIVIEYRCKVREIPQNNILMNSASIDYDYLIDMDKQVVRKQALSNIGGVTINDINLSGENIRAFTDKDYVVVGEEVIYTIKILNTGNIPGKNTVLKGKIPEGTVLVKNSIFVDGRLVQAGDIEDGIFLGNIIPNKLVEVSYRLYVNKIPIGSIILNEMKLHYVEQINPSKIAIDKVIEKEFNEVYVNSVNLRVDRTCNSDYATVGEIITYSLSICNLGTVDLEDIVLRDTLSSELEYVEGSIKLDGKIRNSNIINGFNIGTIEKGKGKTLQFKARVLSYPKDGRVLTRAIYNYKYTLNPKMNRVSGSSKSEIDILNIKKIDLSIKKICNSTEVCENDVINYKVIIYNKGEVNIENLIFKENLPEEFRYIENTFHLNKVKIRAINLKSGIRIGTLKRGSSVEILFDAKVENGEYTCITYSDSHGEYSYRLKSNGEVHKGKCEVASSKFRISNSITRDITIDGICELVDAVGCIENINNIRANIEIDNSYIRKSSSGIIGEDKEKYYKVIINGVLRQMIDFDIRTPIGVVSNTAEFSKKFSSFISLPATYNCGENIDIKAKIQDIFCNEIDTKNINTSVLVTFMVSIL